MHLYTIIQQAGQTFLKSQLHKRNLLVIAILSYEFMKQVRSSERSEYHRENILRVKEWSLAKSRHAFSELRKSLPSRKLTYELLRKVLSY